MPLSPKCLNEKVFLKFQSLKCPNDNDNVINFLNSLETTK